MRGRPRQPEAGATGPAPRRLGAPAPAAHAPLPLLGAGPALPSLVGESRAAGPLPMRRSYDGSVVQLRGRLSQPEAVAAQASRRRRRVGSE